jgi:hypothetical protein
MVNGRWQMAVRQASGQFALAVAILMDRTVGEVGRSILYSLAGWKERVYQITARRGLRALPSTHGAG